MTQPTFRVRVGKTKFGHGVFAAKVLHPDDVVGEITGIILDDPDYSSDYCMELGGDLTLEPAPPFRFLNHSCEPNCELFQWEADGADRSEERRLWLGAIRPVFPGEELTIDYAWPADSAMRCECESPVCRGWIVDAAEAHRLRVRPAG